jgi:hypothetical protein
MASSVAAEDLTDQDRIAETNRLLDALRIAERSPSVRVIGLSEFTYAEELPVEDPKLADFAKRIGADYVVVTCRYGGKTNQTVMQPVTTFSNANSTAYVTGSNGYSATGYATGQETSTTLVPTQVQRNVFVHSAIFLRRVRPQDPVSR